MEICPSLNILDWFNAWSCMFWRPPAEVACRFACFPKIGFVQLNIWELFSGNLKISKSKGVLCFKTSATLASLENVEALPTLGTWSDIQQHWPGAQSIAAALFEQSMYSLIIYVCPPLPLICPALRQAVRCSLLSPFALLSCNWDGPVLSSLPWRLAHCIH